MRRHLITRDKSSIQSKSLQEYIRDHAIQEKYCIYHICNTIVITSPGHYTICNDIQFNSVSTTAIVISGSNITLDFCGHSITSSQTINNICVSILKESSNIKIINGTISKFQYGILFDIDLHDITIEKMRFVEQHSGLIGPNSSGDIISSGIDSNDPHSSNIKIESCVFKKGLGNIISPFSCIQLFLTDGFIINSCDYSDYVNIFAACIVIESSGRITNCAFHNIISTSYIIFLDIGKSSLIENCIISDCKFVQLLGPQSFAISINGYNSGILKNCTITNCTSNCDFGAIIIDFNESSLIKDCVIMNNSMTGDPDQAFLPPASVTGIIVYASGQYSCDISGINFSRNKSNGKIQCLDVRTGDGETRSPEGCVNVDKSVSSGNIAKLYYSFIKCNFITDPIFPFTTLVTNCKSTNNIGDETSSSFDCTQMTRSLIRNCTVLNENVGFNSFGSNRVTFDSNECGYSIIGFKTDSSSPVLRNTAILNELNYEVGCEIPTTVYQLCQPVTDTGSINNISVIS